MAHEQIIQYDYAMNTFKLRISKAASATILTASLLSITQPALALDFTKLNIKASTTINKDCSVSDGYEPILGCFINRYVPEVGSVALVPKPTIYLRADLPKSLLPYVFMENVGQYLAMHYSDQELAAVFNPVPDQFGSQNVRRAAASTFAYWALGGTVTPQKLTFFREAMAQ